MYLKFLDLLLKLSTQGLLIFNLAKKLTDFKVLPKGENDGKNAYTFNMYIQTNMCMCLHPNIEFVF